MSKYIIGLCILFANIAPIIHAQNCGTKIPEEYTNKLKAKRTTLKSGLVPDALKIPNINLSVSVFFVTDYVDSGYVQEAFDSLNIAFQPIGISFSICSFDTVIETDYAIIDGKTKEEKLTNHYSYPNTINLYLTDKLIADGDNVCGYAYLPHKPLLNYIFIDESCDIGKTLIHEMGHFFGLLHPHETKSGNELSDGSNCETTGDLICDTDASPELSSLVDANCEYIGELKDGNGDFFLPSVANHMGYAPNECRCSFTAGQYQLMLESYWGYLTDLR